MYSKIMVLFIALSALICGVVFAAEMGKLNIVTDMEDAYIFIDGSQVGQNYIKDYLVESGSHYVVVKRNDKKIYAQSIYIAPGEVRTIPTAHFVDIKTSTPNRGALEVEAARIRETRGNGAFGIFAGTPLSAPTAGLSVKWWVLNPFGIQFMGSASGNNEMQESQFAGRLLYNLGTKIWFEQPLDAYWAIGYGRKYFDDKTAPDKDYAASIIEGALGLEFGIGNIFFSIEGGIENTMKETESKMNMKASGGIHYYF